MRIYYAHPKAHYGTVYEEHCLRIIHAWGLAKTARETFGMEEVEVVNPSEEFHQKAARLAGGIDYFVKIVQGCDFVIAASFDDGEWGAGVYREMDAAKPGCLYRISDKLSPPTTSITQIEDYRAFVPLSINETSRRNKAEQL